MQLSTHDGGEYLVVQPTRGRLDAEIAFDFKQSMVDLFNDGHQKIILDLSDVEFIDSSGLGSIVSALKVIGRHGELKLCGVKDTVMSTFKLTRMDRVFKMYPSEYEAMNDAGE